MMIIGRCSVVIVTVVVLVFGSAWAEAYPYANGFPYSTAPIVSEAKLVKGVSASGSGAEGGKDLRDFNRDHAFEGGNRINSAADAVRYHALDNQLNGHRIADTSKGGSVDKVKHLAGENFEADKSHNRKQIKSGFSNSYHKDETGSKSSYYEDSDDRGGKQVYDNRHNLRNNYNDHLFNKELRNDQLRDQYDDHSGGADHRGIRDFHHQAAVDRGNLHDYRDGFRDDHQDQYMRAFGHEVYPQVPLPPMVPVRNYDELFRRRSFYEPRPMFTTGPHAPAPITVYEDPRDYVGGPSYEDDPRRFPHQQQQQRVRPAGDGFMRRFDEDFSDRTRIVFRPSPLLNYRRRY